MRISDMLSGVPLFLYATQIFEICVFFDRFLTVFFFVKFTFLLLIFKKKKKKRFIFLFF